MLRFILLTFFTIYSVVSISQVNILWSQRFSSLGSNTDRAVEMTSDLAGNIYVTGITYGTSGNFDILTVKYSSSGTLLWSRAYNGAGNGLDEGRGIAVDLAGNVYVVGWTCGASNNYNYVTIKYNGSTGTQLWAQVFNGTANTTDDPYDIAVDGNANVYVTGGTNSTTTGEDYGTLKYDSTGALIWTRTYSFTGNNIDKAQALCLDASGNIYVTGFSSGSGSGLDYATIAYDAAGTAIWGTPHRYNGPGNSDDNATAITVNSATGNVYITGYSRNASVVDYDYATVMINSTGGQVWVQRYGGTAAELDRANDIIVEPGTGACYVTGKVKNSASLEDMTTIKYDNTGVQQWIVSYNANNNFEEGKSLMLEPTLTYLYLSGSSNPGTGSNDYYTFKLRTSDGSSVWSTRYNGPGNGSDLSFDMLIDAQENVVVTGQSMGNGTGADAFTIKYCQMTASAGLDTSICLNASVQLNASAPGAVSYLWSPSTGLSCTSCPNPIANPTVTTNYAVTITNANGCTDMDTVTVTVFPLPGPSINASGPTTFCFGDSVTLSGPNNYNYLWSPGNQTTQSITVNISATYSLTITDTNTCAAQSSIGVFVNPLPAVDAGLGDSVCLSQTAQLNASGALNYLWSPGNTLSDSTIANPQAGMVVTTTYTVIGTDANGCSNTDVVTIVINPNPPVPIITYNGGILTSTAASSYQWYTMSPATLIPGATGQTFQPLANDTFFVVVFDANGCSTSSAFIIINDVGIEDYDFLFNSQVYPNPSNGEFTLQFLTSSSQDVILVIRNMEGQEISRKEFFNTIGEVKVDYDLDLGSGMYFVSLVSGNGTANRKFIIRR
jgi:hypothetical protein